MIDRCSRPSGQVVRAARLESGPLGDGPRAALYVTAPGFNVTLTMYALSYWLGSALIAGVGGQPEYSTEYLEGSWAQLLDGITRLDGDTMIARAIRSGNLV